MRMMEIIPGPCSSYDYQYNYLQLRLACTIALLVSLILLIVTATSGATIYLKRRLRRKGAWFVVLLWVAVVGHRLLFERSVP